MDFPCFLYRFLDSVISNYFLCSPLFVLLLSLDSALAKLVEEKRVIFLNPCFMNKEYAVFSFGQSNVGHGKHPLQSFSFVRISHHPAWCCLVHNVVSDIRDMISLIFVDGLFGYTGRSSRSIYYVCVSSYYRSSLEI